MVYELTTKAGKSIKLDKAELQISINKAIASGYFVDLKLTGVLPGCKKSVILTINFSSSVDSVNITTLFNHRKWHEVTYTEMKSMIESIPVKPYIIKPPEITPEVEAFAREEKINMYGRR